MRRLRLVAVLVLVAWPASTFGQSNLPFEFQPMHAPAPDLGLKAPIAYPKPLRYGDKAWQSIDFYPTKSAEPAPLVIAFSSAAKGWDRYRFNQAGIAIAFVPDDETVPTARKTVDNYLSAIATLYNNAEQLGIDRSRFVLYGFGGGGSMAVLLGTDPTLLGRAGVPFEAVRGVVSVGGEDFDVVRRSSKNAFLRARYLRYYGSDAAETASLSPATYLAAPNAPGFLLLARERDTDAFEESGLIAEALMKAGSPATFVALPEQHEGVRRTYLLVEQGGSGWEIMDFVQAALRAPR